MDFSRISDNEKEEFCNRIIQKQLNLINQLGESLINESMVKGLFKNINVTILSKRLYGVMCGAQIIAEFIKVIDEMC